MKRLISNFKLSTINSVLILTLAFTASMFAYAEEPGTAASSATQCQAKPLGEYLPVPPGVSEATPPTEFYSGHPDLIPAGEIEQFPYVVSYECLANNTNCSVFYAINVNPYFAQDAAMDLCFTYGYPCRPLGCHILP
ncbi:MAG: hypothetical protein ABIQ95_12340 [Bdellovibrionia bacterium]